MHKFSNFYYASHSTIKDQNKIKSHPNFQSCYIKDKFKNSNQEKEEEEEEEEEEDEEEEEEEEEEKETAPFWSLILIEV